MIKHIVFDFGGVLLDLDGVHTGYPDDLAQIFHLPVDKAKQIWNDNKTQVITGKETPKEFLARIKDEFSLTFDVEQGIVFWEERNTIVRERIDWELVELIKQLNSKYGVHMLTDQIQLQNGATAWIDQMNVHFHTILRSYEQGFRKPFANAYQNLLIKINAEKEPESVLFIDDNKENIEAAQKLGIQGILYSFKNHQMINDSFKNLGIPFFITQ